MIGPRDALAAIGQLADGEIDLADAALQLGRSASADPGRSGPALAAARAHLSELARASAGIGRVLAGRTLEARVGALAGLIHAGHGYAGDVETYDDLANADLARVIARRRGLPVALGIVWLHCVRAAGWQAHGVDFPGHFLIRLGEDLPAGPRRGSRREQHLLVDVFANGAALGVDDLLALQRRVVGEAAEIRPGLLRPMSSRDVLLRLQRNVSERLLGAGRVDAALDVVETMLAIAPDHATLWRDAAGLNQRLDRIPAAIACLERFLDLVPAGDAAARVRARIDELRRRPA